MNTLAIDIGGTKIALGLIKDGQLDERIQIPTTRALSAEQFAGYILEHCQTWLNQVDKIGVSTTGLVTEQGISAINPDTLAFPTPFPLQQALEKATNKPTLMLNDAQAAAWYEYLHIGHGANNMAYLTVSTGVGGGLIIDGKLHRGHNNFAGHIGHMVVDPNGPLCGCGLQGCVEALASGTAIQKVARQQISACITNVELFQRAHHDTQANAIIDSSAQAIATVCSNLKASLDLDIIVIGGGVGLADGYIERIRRYIANKPAVFQVTITKAKGNHDACLLGAAALFD
ncbi:MULTISPECIES: N-acetylmannosamine kinase [Vibrio]|uniref:N-acetylmannosamine kinase n=1 Tax=Vibrio TaxID=662 RepID=UPI003D0DF664